MRCNPTGYTGGFDLRKIMPGSASTVPVVLIGTTHNYLRIFALADPRPKLMRVRSSLRAGQPGMRCTIAAQVPPLFVTTLTDYYNEGVTSSY